MNKMRTWLELDQNAYINNLIQLKKLAGNCKLAVVLKSNAYGHGLINLAQLTDKIDFVEYICAAGINDALLIRRSGLTKKIMVLSYLDGSFQESIENNIDLVLYDYDHAKEISDLAVNLNKTVNVQIKIDTGMTRFGVPYNSAIEFIQKIKSLSNINITGIFTHLCDTDNEDLSYTNYQLNNFDKILDDLENLNINIPYRHAYASGALSFTQNPRYTMVRVGGLIYGMYKSELHKKRILSQDLSIKLKSILSWKTQISQLKTVPAETYIGYNKAYITAKETKIAILSVGYFDGVPRALSNNGFVMVRGKFAPIVGIVSMNVVTIDVTHIDNVALYDEVILLGDFEGIRPEDWAKKAGTINNEITTRINGDILRLLTSNLNFEVNLTRDKLVGRDPSYYALQASNDTVDTLGDSPAKF